MADEYMFYELLVLSIYILLASAIVSIVNKTKLSQYLIIASMMVLSIFSIHSIFVLKVDWIETASIPVLPFLDSEAIFLTGMLNTLFLFALSIVGISVTLYSGSYFFMKQIHGKEEHYWFYLSILFLSLIIFFTSSNLIYMIISIDIATLFTALLVAHERHSRRARSMGQLYVIVGITASAFIALASMAIYRSLHTLDIIPVHGLIDQELMLISSIFMAIGFSIKAGLFPFHAWLPRVHSEALAPISAVLSGLLTKTGIYGLILFSTYVLKVPIEVEYILLLMGLASMFYGGIIALAQRDIKRLIAYSTISNNGYVVFTIAISLHLIYSHSSAYVLAGSIVFPAIVLLTMNYIFGKSLLFLISGSIESIIRTRDLFKMGMLKKYMFRTYILTIISILILVGLPPSIGFIAKTLVHIALLKTSLTFITDLSIAGLVSLISASYMFKLLFRAFHFKTEYMKLHGIVAHKLSDPPSKMLFGMTLLSIPAIMISIYPRILYPLFSSFATSIGSIENIISYLDVYPLLILIKTMSPLTIIGYVEEIAIVAVSLFLIPLISFISFLIWEHIETVSHFIHSLTDQLFGRHIPRGFHGVKDRVSILINSFEENYVATIFLSIVILIILLVILSTL